MHLERTCISFRYWQEVCSRSFEHNSRVFIQITRIVEATEGLLANVMGILRSKVCLVIEITEAIYVDDFDL